MMLYLECRSGVTADLMLASLVSLMDDPNGISEMFSAAGVPARITAERSESSSISGIKLKIVTDEDHHGHVHHSLSGIIRTIDSLKTSDRVKQDAKGVFGILAKAESEIHDMPIDDVHFHEVGSPENVAAVIGICLMIERLSPERIVSSPVCTGFGHVRCAHGILPIPAPAAASILKGIPVYAGEVEGEMCTPTGAALLAHFVSSYGNLPSVEYSRIGYGLTSKTEAFRLLRSFLCESSD